MFVVISVKKIQKRVKIRNWRSPQSMPFSLVPPCEPSWPHSPSSKKSLERAAYCHAFTQQMRTQNALHPVLWVKLVLNRSFMLWREAKATGPPGGAAFLPMVAAQPRFTVTNWFPTSGASALVCWTPEMEFRETAPGKCKHHWIKHHSRSRMVHNNLRSKHRTSLLWHLSLAHHESLSWRTDQSFFSVRCSAFILLGFSVKVSHQSKQGLFLHQTETCCTRSFWRNDSTWHRFHISLSARTEPTKTRDWSFRKLNWARATNETFIILAVSGCAMSQKMARTGIDGYLNVYARGKTISWQLEVFEGSNRGVWPIEWSPFLLDAPPPYVDAGHLEHNLS